jgi:hypothetical protein
MCKNKLEVQKFLQEKSVEDLTAELGIAVKQHPRYPELYHFSYDQLESPKDNAIVQECRGLILSSKHDWAVVAYPFKRFGNYGEQWAAPVDWTTARVQEKVDGSLLVMWWYDGRWNVSTKGSPDAGGQVGDWGMTFAELFWETLDRQELELQTTAAWNLNQTYLFELTSPYNRVVCSYGKVARLTLIGLRNVIDLLEVAVSSCSWFPTVKEYSLTSVADVLAAAEALDPMSNEGFVVVDAQFNRIKVKSPSYVMIHHMKDGFGQRRIIRLIQLGEQSEVLSYFPEYQELFEDIRAKIDGYLTAVEADYEQIKHISDRKAFAMEATKTRNPGVMFALHQGKATSVRDYILHSRRSDGTFQFTEDKIEHLIGMKSRGPLRDGSE